MHRNRADERREAASPGVNPGRCGGPKMSFVDSLMDMLKNGKEEDGAATARNNLSQTWDYPSLVAALPYRYYDDK
jgi:hypothetical protein